MNQFLSRKSGLMALLISVFVAIGAPAYAAQRTSGLWWMPDVASKSGEQIDQLTYFIYYLTGAVFVLTQIVYIYFLIKYRAKKGVRATYSHGDNRLELVWTAIPTAIFIGLWGYSNHMWLRRHPQRTAAGYHGGCGECLPVWILFSVPGRERKTWAIGCETAQC